MLAKFLEPVSKRLLKADTDVSFYTGLPNIKCFQALVKYHNDLLPKSQNRHKNIRFNVVAKYCKWIPAAKKPTKKLRSEERVLMVLMKLRLGLLHKDLADR